MSSKEWWKDTAIHMWRTYFALLRDGFVWENLSDPNKRIYALCNHIYLKNFTKSDQDILKMYFSSHWGDDQYVVNEYSERTGTPDNRERAGTDNSFCVRIGLRFIVFTPIFGAQKKPSFLRSVSLPRLLAFEVLLKLL